MADNHQVEKLHAACDECRTRKLKCSGETPNCSRCEKEGIQCVYSPQKQMGRPRKRRRDDAEKSSNEQTPNLLQDSSSDDFSSQPGLIDFGMISSSGLNDYSGFPDFQSAHEIEHPLAHTQTDPALTTAYQHKSLPVLDLGLGANIDPSLWNAQPSRATLDPTPTIPSNTASQSPCTCLSIMYLTMTDLQTMTSFAFPQVVPTLRHAMSTASAIIHCEKCPQETFMAIQNVITLSSLLSAIATRFHKVLNEINEETKRLQQTGEKKPFRIGDNNPAHAHMHTGTLDCPMGFNIELDAVEWGRLSKKALKTEVLGGGSNPAPLISLVEQFESRQTKWHLSHANWDERARMFGAQNMCKDPENAHCVRMVSQVRTMIASMVWE